MIQSVHMTTYFEYIPDPRTFRTAHQLVDIVAIALLSKLCGAEGWEDMHEFGNTRKEWLSTFLELPSGIPSPDTFRRVICGIDPSAFLESVLDWMKAVQEVLPGLVSIDGQTLRSTLKRGDTPLHVVSAWCEKNHMILGQLRNDSKSNEIKTIPLLLKQLTLPEGSIITIDAAGTQREIARQIREMKADYLLALKGNQPNLQDEIENYFNQALEAGSEYVKFSETMSQERGHGRTEVRRVYATDDLDWLSQKDDWADLRSIVRLDSERWVNEKRHTETRYYISSLPPDAEKLSHAIRGHWGIENHCHWTLDVIFGIDESLITKGYAPENLRTVSLLAAKMLKSEKTCKKGLKAKQFKAALDPDYLHKVLLASNF
jgi:predicted transposase YbfD/YdcC